jgi:hypothetical protein
MRTRAFFTALATAALAAGCAPDAALGPGVPVEVTRFPAETGIPTVWSGIGAPATIVVRGEATWESAWEAIWSDHQPIPPRPEVDFSRHVVLIAALGAQPSTGYGIRVEGATDRSSHVDVHVVRTEPGRRCGVGHAITNPLDAVLLPATVDRVQLRETRSVHDCR